MQRHDFFGPNGAGWIRNRFAAGIVLAMLSDYVGRISLPHHDGHPFLQGGSKADVQGSPMR
jgi:hypothetical protein